MKKQVKKEKRKPTLGQTAFEFFVTYSWAIALLAVVAALVFTNGIPGIQLFTSKQASLPGFTVLDFKVDSNGTMVLELGNSINRNIQLTGTAKVNGVQLSITPIGNSTLSLAKGEKGQYLISNALQPAPVGQAFEIKQLSIDYITRDTGIQHASHGFATGTREAAIPIAIPEAEPTLLFQWNNQTDFDAGQHSSTSWSNNGVTLSSTSGTFVSNIVDAGKAVNWTNVTWTQSTPYSDATPSAAKLVARWSFDEAEEQCNPTDKGNYGNNAVFKPTCKKSNFKPGKVGNGVCLNGAGESLVVNNSASLNVKDTSIELWVYDDDNIPNWYYLVEKGYNNQYRVGLTNNNKIRWLVSGFGEVFSRKSIPKKKWTHVAVTYKDNPPSQSDIAKIYIDGAVDATYVGYGTHAVTSDPLVIGATKFDERHFKGCFDEIRIYNAMLNDTEVRSSYNATSSSVKFQIRSCSDAACTNFQFIGPDGTSNTFYVNPGKINLTINRYVQFKINLATDNLTIKPKIFKVTISAAKVK